MARQIFARKPLEMLLEEMKGENRLRRVLGPVQLSSLGIGAIIGAGIFVLTGKAAHDKAGPALILSFVVSGIGCVFAALCYAEFASMVPVAGSAYTYAYATMGELFAWIIGWDLVLEYTVVSATVANGWSQYFQDFLSVFGIKLPHGLAAQSLGLRPDGREGRLHGLAHRSARDDHHGDHHRRPGHRHPRERQLQHRHGRGEARRGPLRDRGRLVLRQPGQLASVRPVRLTGVSFFGNTVFGRPILQGKPLGMLAGAAIVFFAYIGFDSVSTHAEEAATLSATCPIGIIVVAAHLHRALHRGGRGPDRDGPVPGDQHQRAGVERLRLGRPAVGPGPHLGRSAGRHHVRAARHDAQPAASPAGDGPRRPVAPELLRRGPRDASAPPGSPRS